MPEVYFSPNSPILTANVCVVHIHYILGLQGSRGKSTGGTAVLILLRSIDTGQRHQGEKAGSGWELWDTNAAWKPLGNAAETPLNSALKAFSANNFHKTISLP